jgi:hypothetical protein
MDTATIAQPQKIKYDYSIHPLANLFPEMPAKQAAQAHIVRQFAALRAHTHKTFQAERTPAERKVIISNLAAFVKANPFLRARLAA